MNYSNMKQLVLAIGNSAHLHGAHVVECTGEANKYVRVTFCCIGHANNVVSTFKKIGAVNVIQTGVTVSFRYRTQKEMLRVQ